ncbi:MULTISPECIES: hypothetical protein [Acetobacter]|uniref:CopG family transcriptional regulator n=1 Tax=Acetobacter thailandicus TaxID=1502842 RepID=A0ABT3QE89_9PROT|nr:MULTISPECIES: hypothetical protein [Acetobacter]MBS0960648.1 hypothetical protein [Acetobacter thailandicus]MBS0980263.1 hypothetical protein [Acetobacter thailandicus]MBS0986163.1 hypothetical protein [Acetobacter thailandicus]MBS1004064.1 hypothetical protein [Acetobacter thailandicus]MCX2563598.1 hypothetical protein [Acetobacter thailandicus]
MTALSAEAFLKPRIDALVREAELAGYNRDVAIALLISLLDTGSFIQDPTSVTTQGKGQ